MDANANLNSAAGYQRAPESMQPRTYRVVFLQKRLWVLRCSARTGKAGLALPDNEVRSGELFALALHVLWMGLSALWQQATRRHRATRYQPDENTPRQSRRKL